MTICGLTVVFARLFVLMAVTSWNHEKVTLQVVWPVSPRNTDIFTRLKITWTTCFCFLGFFLQVILKVLVGWLCYWIGFTSFKSYYSAAIFKKKKKEKPEEKKCRTTPLTLTFLPSVRRSCRQQNNAGTWSNIQFYYLFLSSKTLHMYI